jgi:hypothetical protein
MCCITTTQAEAGTLWRHGQDFSSNDAYKHGHMPSPSEASIRGSSAIHARLMLVLCGCSKISAAKTTRIKVLEVLVHFLS